MAFKMKSGNKPGFKNMGSSPVREHNMFHKTANFDGSLDVKKEQLKTDQDNKLNEVNIPDDKPVKRDIVGPKLIPKANTEPTLVKADDTKFKRSDKQRLAREKVASDVNAFVSGVAGVPGDVIEGITSKVSAASNFVKKGIDKRKLKKEEKKQNKIDNLSAFDKKEQKKMDRENRKKAKLYEKKTKKDAKSTEENKVKKEVVVKKDVKKVVTPKKAVDKKKKVVTPKKDVVKKKVVKKEVVKKKKELTEASKKLKPGEFSRKRKLEGKLVVNQKLMNKKVDKEKKPSKIKEYLSKAAKSKTAQDIGVGVATAGVTAGINALASGKKKTIRERPNIAGGFSTIKFGRKSRLTD